MSNIVKRNTAKTPSLPKLKTPRWLSIYWEHLKQVLEVIGICFAGAAAFGVPLAGFIWLVAIAVQIPQKTHVGALYWLGLLVFSVFWYTGVYAFFHHREQMKYHRRGY